MDNPNPSQQKEFMLGIDEETEQQYSLHSNLLQQFISISSIDKSRIFNSKSGKFKFKCKSTSKFQFHLIMLFFTIIADSSSQGMMFFVSQPNLLANKKRKFILSATVNKRSDGSVSLDWARFPVEMNGGSVMVPSPSGSKLLIVRNPEGDGGCRFEIWSNSSLENEFCVPQSKHGSVYADGW